MLVLTRAIDESIVINDNIVITVVDVRGDKVRLGVLAPMDVPVHRQEVHEAIVSWQAPEEAVGPDAADNEDGSPATIELSPAQLQFIDRIAQQIAQRGDDGVTRSQVVQSILSGVEHLADEICRASSPAEIQQMFRTVMRGAERA